MLLKAVGHHRVPVDGMLFALLTDVHLARALQVDSLEGMEGSVAGDRRFPCSAAGS